MMASTSQDRLAASAGSLTAVALIGYVFLFGLSVPTRILTDDVLTLLPLSQPKPEPRPKPVTHHEPKKKAHAVRQRASPAALKAEASPIVAPIPIPIPSPVIAAPTPNIGTLARNGASDRPGPGQGAGGEGDGPGGGGDGDGGDTPPRQIKGKLSFSDMPSALRVEGVERTVAVRYTVNVDGRVSGCSVTETSGSPELDTTACRLIEQRFRFVPAKDGDGAPTRSVVEEEHSWRLERSAQAPDG